MFKILYFTYLKGEVKILKITVETLTTLKHEGKKLKNAIELIKNRND